MATTKTPQELLTQAKSSEPVECIDACIQLLRLWPAGKEQKLKTHFALAISDDARAHRGKTVDYVLGIDDVQQRAYAVMAVDFGLRIDENRQPPPVDEQQQHRQRFVAGIEGLAEKLHEIGNTKSRLEVAEILAREAQEKPALAALEKTWEIGWQVRVPALFYTDEHGRMTVAESLLSTAAITQLSAVKRKALEYLGEISDERERREYLEKALTSEDATTALFALDVFMQKIIPLSNGRAGVALDALMARHVLLDGGILSTANRAVVERAFDIYMENKKPEERLPLAYHFFSDHFKMWLTNRNQEHPKGLLEKAGAYLVAHFDEVKSVQNKETREGILLHLISHRNDVASKAIDYIAQPEDEMEGVANIAQIYRTAKTIRLRLPDENMEKVTQWALRYTRKFAELPDENLAREVLGHIGGWPETDDPDSIGWNGDGTHYKEEESGKRYDLIAREELAKLPRQPT